MAALGGKRTLGQLQEWVESGHKTKAPGRLDRPGTHGLPSIMPPISVT